MRYAAIVLLTACDTHGMSPQGQLHGECLPDGSCSAGLVCLDNRCTALDALPPNFDVPPDGFACADDSALEPNDTIQTAFATPVDATSTMIAFAGLAICPVTDKDHYRMTVSTANTGLEVIVTGNSTLISLAMLNAGGSPIASGTPLAGAIRVCAPNLPLGNYFARVTATAPANYSVAINRIVTCN